MFTKVKFDYSLDKFSVAEIRTRAKEQIWNGSYSKTICRNCGMVYVNKDSTVDDAEVVSVCSNCY